MESRSDNWNKKIDLVFGAINFKSFMRQMDFAVTEIDANAPRMLQLITKISRDIRVDISPGSTQYYTPLCDPDLKPFVGQEFKTLDDGLQFYKKYAVQCGFDIRRSTLSKSNDGACIRRYVVCSREGMRMTWAVQEKRRRVSKRVSCKARVIFKFVSSDKYIVDKFIEQHTHSLCSEMYKHFLNFLLNCSRANIGPTKCYRLFKDTVRGYSNVDVAYGACKVVYDKSQNTTTCSCKKFVRVGLLCCHVFYVFKDLNLQSIPEKYLVSRWTKYALLKPIFEVHGQIIDQCAMIEERKSIMNQLFSEFYSCIGLTEGNNDFMTSLLHSLKNQRHIFTSGVDQSSSIMSKKKLFEDCYGGSVPQKVQALPPLPVKTKGSGSRLKSRKEKAIEKSNKPLRKCRSRKRSAKHISRLEEEFDGETEG
ncbi:FAR1-related protein [Striga asiatica]|uniref:FAR1-related protein n=1 Tax=Striga asiatica TaxID=4170 RepID=A0A5A7RFC6_STRAF|nr:FAR1-related protein [Striga asiatica]